MERFPRQRVTIHHSTLCTLMVVAVAFVMNSSAMTRHVRNAYIQIALTGKNFCAAAKAGLTLFARNFVRFAWITMLGGAVNIIGLAFIVAILFVQVWKVMFIIYVNLCISKTPAACHRRTPKQPPQAICGYCVSIFAFPRLGR